MRICTRCKSAPGCLFAPPNLHHLQRWSKLAPGCRFAPGCIFIKHRLYDQNTPNVQIYTPGVYLHRGVYCAYERGFSINVWRVVIAMTISIHFYVYACAHRLAAAVRILWVACGNALLIIIFYSFKVIQ